MKNIIKLRDEEIRYIIDQDTINETFIQTL